MKETALVDDATCAAIDAALAQPTGPTFLDYPLDVVFQEAESDPPPPPEVGGEEPAAGVEEAAALLAAAERPAIMAGTGLYWAHGEDELRALAEALGAPTFLNGMGRGCLPADHELCFSRARGKGLKEADVVIVVGVPLDFRLGFGGSVGEDAKLIWLDAAPNTLTANRKPMSSWSARSRRASVRSATARPPAPTRRARRPGCEPWPTWRPRSARPSARNSRMDAPRCIPCASTGS